MFVALCQDSAGVRGMPSGLPATLCCLHFTIRVELLLPSKDSVVTTYNSELSSSMVRLQSCSPNSILDIPDYLRRWHPDISRRKLCSRRGMRGGVAVKLKIELCTGHVSSFFHMTRNLCGGRCAIWHSLDLPARWLRPIHMDSPFTTSRYSPLYYLALLVLEVKVMNEPDKLSLGNMKLKFLGLHVEMIVKGSLWNCQVVFF